MFGIQWVEGSARPTSIRTSFTQSVIGKVQLGQHHFIPGWLLLTHLILYDDLWHCVYFVIVLSIFNFIFSSRDVCLNTQKSIKQIQSNFYLAMFAKYLLSKSVNK